jgi:hypothetical protein
MCSWSATPTVPNPHRRQAIRLIPTGQSCAGDSGRITTEDSPEPPERDPPEPDPALGACELLDAPGEAEPEEEEEGELEEDGLGDEDPWDGDSGAEESWDGSVAAEVDGAEDVSDTGADGVAGGVSELVGEVAVDGELGAGVATAGRWKTDVSSGGRAGIGTGSTIGGTTGAGATGAGAAGAGAAGAGAAGAGAGAAGAGGWAAGGATNTVRGASWTTGIGAWMVSGATDAASCTADGAEV